MRNPALYGNITRRAVATVRVRDRESMLFAQTLAAGCTAGGRHGLRALLHRDTVFQVDVHQTVTNSIHGKSGNNTATSGCRAAVLEGGGGPARAPSRPRDVQQDKAGIAIVDSYALVNSSKTLTYLSVARVSSTILVLCISGPA